MADPDSSSRQTQVIELGSDPGLDELDTSKLGPDPSLERFRSIMAVALKHLEAYRQQLNDLNVFPVADGDTGDNMVLTIRSVLDELDRLAAQGDIDEIGRSEIVKCVARAALLGARGNSGVILSQMIRGAAEELISRRGELVDPVLIGAALARAADRAYESVRDPQEGTILSVVRAMAHRVASELAHMPNRRLNEPVTVAEQDVVIAAVLDHAFESAKEALDRGTQLLPALRDAGVVDAGGLGVTVVLAGIISGLRGEPPERVDAALVSPVSARGPQHHSSTYRFCTNFAVTGRNLKAVDWRDKLEQLGDSVLVVGDSTTLRVHVHTDHPEQATALFDGVGSVMRLDVGDMRAQVAARSARIAHKHCGALAVVSSDGIASLYQDLGVATLIGGPTLNPSTYDILTGIHGVPADEVVVLPNSPNVQMAAEHAAELSEKTVHVVATRTQQAGLVAAVALVPERSARVNAETMLGSVSSVRTGSIAPAARDDSSGRFKSGEAVGFIEEELVAWGEPAQTVQTVLEQIAADAELMSVIEGEDAPLGADTIRGLVPAGVELEYAVGGQPNYWWLIAAE